LIPPEFELRETTRKDYLHRTEANVVDSDATLVFTWDPPRGGTKKSIEFANKHGKSCHVCDIKQGPRKALVEHICRWLEGEIEEEEWPQPPEGTLVLNVAGPRESKVPGMQRTVMILMIDVLREVNPECRRLTPAGGQGCISWGLMKKLLVCQASIDQYLVYLEQSNLNTGVDNE
jgi:hypothetical protein